jgi:uridine kinase
VGRRDALAALAERIAALERPHPVRVAIDGVDAAGKTTLADELVEPLGRRGRPVVRASLDAFHNPAAIRYRRSDAGESYYRDSFDHAGLVAALLGPLGPGGSRRYRRAIFDYRVDEAVHAPLEEAPPDAVLLFDGVFLLRPELRGHWDLSVFVHAPFDVTLERALVRDRELFGSDDAVRERYRTRYVPGQRLYLREAEPERRASLVLENGDPARPRLRGTS